MQQEFCEHRWAYLILVGGLLAFVVLFVAIWPDRSLQRLVALAISLFYAAWGIMTHLHTQTISRRVVAEYLSVSALALVLLLLVTL